MCACFYSTGVYIHVCIICNFWSIIMILVPGIALLVVQHCYVRPLSFSLVSYYDDSIALAPLDCFPTPLYPFTLLYMLDISCVPIMSDSARILAPAHWAGCVNLCVSSYVLSASLLILLRHLMSRRMRVCMYLMIILSYWDLHVFKVTHRVFGCLGSFCQWHVHSVYVCM